MVVVNPNHVSPFGDFRDDVAELFVDTFIRRPISFTPHRIEREIVEERPDRLVREAVVIIFYLVTG